MCSVVYIEVIATQWEKCPAALIIGARLLSAGIRSAGIRADKVYLHNNNNILYLRIIFMFIYMYNIICLYNNTD